MESSAAVIPARSADTTELPTAHPPETLEGWYVLHQIFTVGEGRPQADSARDADVFGAEAHAGEGWTSAVRLIGSSAAIMVMHFRPTLDEIADAQQALARHPAMHRLRLEYSFLSVTEAGLYHLTAQLARVAAARGGSVGDATYVAELAQRSAAERDNLHVRRRLYPSIPEGMPYVCFYPMNKRRDAQQNWYTLSLDERSRLMQTHGTTGRRYAGKVMQVISGAIGFDAWEWGVTLFAKDPLDFKKLVTDMRFDEVSAKYADFGEFYVGKLIPWEELRAVVETI